MVRPNWFIGFPFPATVPLGRLPAKVRAFASEDLHLTLAFFGGISEAAARSAWAKAEAARRFAIKARRGLG